MLNRIVVINSELYAKADIIIGDTASLQLEANNNVGKSSLINTLNFLYILDKRKWEFGDKTAEETIRHYFKTLEQSFVVFEIRKQHPYCIIVKRGDSGSKIEYYKMECAYDNTIFFKEKETAGSFEIRKFKDIIIHLGTTKIILIDTDDLYKLIYNTDKKTMPVVHITDNVNRNGRGHSNSITKMYRYLIKASSIDEKVFKEALMIANNRSEESLNVFLANKQEKIQDFIKKQYELDLLKSIVTDFANFKLIFKDYNRVKEQAGRLKYTFITQYGIESKRLEDETKDNSTLSIQLRTMKTNVEETLPKALATLNTQKGSLEEQQKQANTTLKKSQDEYDAIKEYKKGTLLYNGLEQEVNGLQDERDSLITKLSNATKTNVTENSVRNIITKLLKDKTNLKNQITDFSKLAHQHISSDSTIRQRIFSYLHPKVLEQTSDKITKTVSQIDDVLKIFDGQIDVSEIELLDIPNIETLELSLKTITDEIAEQEELIGTIRTYEEVKIKKEAAENNYKERNNFLDKVNNIATYEQQIEDANNLLTSISTQIIAQNALILNKGNEIEYKKSEYKREQDALNEKKTKLNRYRGWYSILSNHHHITKVEEIIVDKTLDEIYTDYDKKEREYQDKKNTVAMKVQTLKTKLGKDTADDQKFVDETQEEIDSLSSKENALNSLFATTIYVLANDVASFIDKYYRFKEYIISFNRQMSGYSISNLRKITIKAIDNEVLIKELSKISDARTVSFFNASDAEIQEIMSRKFKENREIKFEDLFDIELEIEKHDGKSQKVALGKTVESTGTNAVLKFFLFLNVINQLVVKSADNKLAVYFDELGQIDQSNVLEIVNFCSKNNFIPIFAAPTKIVGVDKYITIKPSKKGQSIIVDANNETLVKRKNADTDI